MSKEKNRDKGALAIGAAVTFCGLTLYAADRLLKFMFRDVDPDRVNKVEAEEAEAIEAEAEEAADAKAGEAEEDAAEAAEAKADEAEADAPTECEEDPAAE